MKRKTALKIPQFFSWVTVMHQLFKLTIYISRLKSIESCTDRNNVERLRKRIVAPTLSVEI